MFYSNILLFEVLGIKKTHLGIEIYYCPADVLLFLLSYIRPGYILESIACSVCTVDGTICVLQCKELFIIVACKGMSVNKIGRPG